MSATTWRTLLGWAGTGVLLGWLFARFLYIARGEVATVPYTAAMVLAVAGVALIYTAIRSRARLEGKQGTKPLPPLVGARLAALALAASRVGALMAGGYSGYALFVIVDLTTDYRRDVVLRCLLCLLGAVVLVIGALLLERVLKLPEDSDEVSATG